jgi:ectoine hydroxylase-related dioxygenase (phytanoyl-CoA dioxygenase family)
LPGDGGFVCIPGSHKTNFIQSVPTEVLKQAHRPDYVIQPELRAGDVLIFTEALIHGTAVWQGEHERRALLYKYSPPHSSWAKVPYDLNDYPGATDQQKRLMAPPSVEDHHKVV